MAQNRIFSRFSAQNAKNLAKKINYSR